MFYFHMFLILSRKSFYFPVTHTRLPYCPQSAIKTCPASLSVTSGLAGVQVSTTHHKKCKAVYVQNSQEKELSYLS